MRPFLIPTFSPDGLGAPRQRNVVAEAFSTIASLAEASRKTVHQPAAEESERYDDGLVHDHGWARSTH